MQIVPSTPRGKSARDSVVPRASSPDTLNRRAAVLRKEASDRRIVARIGRIGAMLAALAVTACSSVVVEGPSGGTGGDSMSSSSGTGGSGGIDGGMGGASGTPHYKVLPVAGTDNCHENGPPPDGDPNLCLDVQQVGDTSEASVDVCKMPASATFQKVHQNTITVVETGFTYPSYNGDAGAQCDQAHTFSLADGIPCDGATYSLQMKVKSPLFPDCPDDIDPNCNFITGTVGASCTLEFKP